MPEDFMPLLGWDYLELWVGNAKQSAYFYEHAMGFTHTAYAGPETGLRDRASYVLEQGDIRLVVTTALREDHEITKHHARHGDGVRDIALTVPDATEAYRQAVSRIASRTNSGRSSSLRSGHTATRFTRSSTAATTRGRSSRATCRSRRTGNATSASGC
jgi:4-hydroxyphenylpyruvate dioxygenase